MVIKEKEIDSIFQKGQVALDKLTRSKTKEALKMYKASLTNIQKEIASLFEKMGDDVSLANAHRYNRLNNLERAIRLEIAKLTGKTAKVTSSAIKEAFRESFNLSGYAVESTLLVKGGFGFPLPSSAVNAHLFNDLSLIKWSDSLKVNQAKYLSEIKQAIGQGLIQGEGYGKIARNVKSRADIGASKLIRIINTETHRAQSEGALEGYNRLSSRAKDIGVEPTKKWISTLDDKTRSSHQSLDQDLAEEIDGQELFTSPNGNTAPAPGLFGVAAEDINCRCSTTVHIEGVDEGKFRRARENGKSVLIENQSYKQWAKSRGVKTKMNDFKAGKAKAPKSLNKSVSKAESSIKNRKTEKAFAFDENGEQILSRSGGRSSIEFTQSELRSMQNTNTTLTHNHPNGISFSKSDLELASTLNLKQVRAVGGKYTYSATSPKGWADAKKISSRYNARANKVTRDMKELARQGKITPAEASELFHDNVWRLVSQDLGFTYERFLTP